MIGRMGSDRGAGRRLMQSSNIVMLKNCLLLLDEMLGILYKHNLDGAWPHINMKQPVLLCTICARSICPPWTKGLI